MVYLFVLWAFAAPAVNLMKLFSRFAVPFSICMFYEAAARWALSLCYFSPDRSHERMCQWDREAKEDIYIGYH